MPEDTSLHKNFTVLDQILTRVLAARDPRRTNSKVHIFNARVARHLPTVTVKWSEASSLIKNDELRGARQVISQVNCGRSEYSTRFARF